MNVDHQEVLYRLAYFMSSMALIASQYLLPWLAADLAQQPLDKLFSPSPVFAMFELTVPVFWQTAMIAYCVGVSCVVALLSFRLADRTNRGPLLPILSAIPAFQFVTVSLIAILPSHEHLGQRDSGARRSAIDVVQGLFAGVILIVLAVLISAVTFGAYGWGLFVVIPFMVGLTTGYIVNRHADRGKRDTVWLGLYAALLGALALIGFALEGLVCIILAGPLAAPLVIAGSLLGRFLAIARSRRRSPLGAVAALPLIFMAEAAVPPEAPIGTHYEIEIAASPKEVWEVLVDEDAIEVAPGFPAWAGLAYPIRSKLAGQEIGATRTGTFSTGKATEEVTVWQPRQALAFRSISHPPAMEEMSPYRRVHAPHVHGYFETGETRFDLIRLSPQRTRLKITSEHVLRIDPIPYWEPIARLAIRENVSRVLRDIKTKAERASLAKP